MTPMSPLLQTMLAVHVVSGVLGVICLYALWMALLHRQVSLPFSRVAALAAAVLLILAWLSGGYYYVVHYGAAVKPVILTSAYPWAHAFFTETKEHLFLFLPFAAAVMAITLWLRVGSAPLGDPLKRALAGVAGTATLIGIFVTLAGIVISGAVR